MWKVNNKIKIEIILTGIVAFLLLMILVLIPFDIFEFYANQETYIKVHNLNPNEKNWEWQYLGSSVYIGMISIVGLTIIIFRIIKKDNKTIKQINWIFLLLFYGRMIIGFCYRLNADF